MIELTREAINELATTIMLDITSTCTPVSRPMFEYEEGYRSQDIAHCIRRTILSYMEASK